LSASFCISLLNWTRQGSTMVACENPNTYFLLWAFIWNGLKTVEAAAAAILVLMNVLRFMGGYYSSSFLDSNSQSGNSGDPCWSSKVCGLLNFILPELACSQHSRAGAQALPPKPNLAFLQQDRAKDYRSFQNKLDIAVDILE